MDVAVVGGGVFGLAAACELAARGHRVRVHEGADAFPSPLAASHDVSKALRRMYGRETARWGPRAIEARDRWRALERRHGVRVYHECGHLALATHDDANAFERASLAAIAAERSALPAPRVLERADLAREFPDLVADGIRVAAFDPIAGWLDAIAAVGLLAAEAARLGVALHTRSPIADVHALAADAVLLAQGAWLAKADASLAAFVRPSLQVEMIFDVAAPRAGHAAWPFWSFDIAEPDGGWYGFGPPARGPAAGRFKVARHVPGNDVDPAAPRIAPAADVAAIAAFVRARLPFLREPAAEIRTCLYAMTPDANFVFAPLPTDAAGPALFVAGGGSGHAFKFGPLLGTWAADAVEGRPVPDEFRLTARSGDRVV